MKFSLRLLTILLTVSVFNVSLYLELPTPVAAGVLDDQLAAVERQLNSIRSEKNGLQTQINAQKNKIGAYSGEIGKLRGEMETLQISTSELDLEIQELELNIKISEEKISQKEKEISQHKESIYYLQDDAETRLFKGYMDFRTRGRNTLDFDQSKDVNTYFKDSQYRQIIQDIANASINTLLASKTQLQNDQTELSEKILEVRKSKAIVDEQKAQLTAKQYDLKKRIEKYYGDIYSVQGNIAGVQSSLNQVSEQEAKTQAQAEQLRQQIFKSFSSIANGRYVTKGTIIGRQGMTGLATGPHVHFLVKNNGTLYNPCTYLNGPGCGGNGQLPYPLKGSFSFTSGYGNRCYGGRCSFHGAIDIASPTRNAPVYAVHDGYLQKGVDQYGGLYIIICQNKNNCNSGFQTGYWHFSSY